MVTGAPSKRDLTVLYFAVLVSRIGFGVLIFVFPSYILGASDIQVAIALAAYPVLEAGTAIPLGRLCDSRGRKWIFVGSLGFLALLMTTIGLNRNIFVAASIHALMGVGAAGVTVSTLTMITDLTGTNNRGAGMGAFDFANVGGYGAGAFLGSRLVVLYRPDLSVAFFLTGGIIAASFLMALLALLEPPHVQRGGSLSLNPLKSLDRRAKIVLPIWLGVTIVLGMVFFLPRAFERAGVGGGASGDVFVAGIVALGIGSVGFGALSDRIGRVKVMLVGVVGLLGLLVMLSISFTTGVQGLYRDFPLIAVFALATSALVPSILATVGDRALLESRGSAMGLYSVMLSGGSAVGTLVAGVVHSSSGLSGIFEAGAVIFGVLCLSSLGLMVWFRKESEQIESQSSGTATTPI